MGPQVLENKLIKELNEILNQEELLWFQKSRNSWIQDGDRNTSFYHRSMIICRNRARIRTLRIICEWTSNKQPLIDHISNFFCNLFGRRNNLGNVLEVNYEGPRIPLNLARNLTRQASVEEVKKSAFGMKRFGSVGPSGIQVVFYQELLEEVKLPITKLVNSTIQTGRIPGKTLEAFITLIPKKDAPESAADFRPITLLNMISKIVSKVMVNRLKPIMAKLIGPC